MPSCGNKRMLKTFLREKWGFDGVVVTDCDSISASWIKPGGLQLPTNGGLVEIGAKGDLHQETDRLLKLI